MPRSTCKEGEGPREKNSQPSAAQKVKKFPKKFFGHLQLTAVRVIKTYMRDEPGDKGRNEANSPGRFSRITGTVSPGKQWLTALEKLTFSMMESPTTAVVRAKKGWGGRGGHELGETTAGGSSTWLGQGGPPEHRSPTSFRSLCRAEEAEVRVGGR